MTVVFKENSKFYEVPNAKIGVLFLHAYTGSANDFNFTARFLQRAGIESLCITFKGHGTNQIMDILNADPVDWWADAQEAFQWLKARNYEKYFVFGLSMGGLFATRLLIENQADNVAGGVFNSPVYTTHPVDVSRHFMRYAKFLYQKQDALAQFTHDEAQIMEAYRRQITEIHFFANAYQLSLAEITGRFYIAQSAKDELIYADDAHLLKDALSSAKVTFAWFEENTHVITTNRHRDAFEASLLAFITA